MVRTSHVSHDSCLNSACFPCRTQQLSRLERQLCELVQIHAGVGRVSGLGRVSGFRARVLGLRGLRLGSTGDSGFSRKRGFGFRESFRLQGQGFRVWRGVLVQVASRV